MGSRAVRHRVVEVQATSQFAMVIAIKRGVDKHKRGENQVDEKMTDEQMVARASGATEDKWRVCELEGEKRKSAVKNQTRR
jgi:hypothetical protein